MDMQIVTGAYLRKWGNLPQLHIQNMIVERARSGERGMVLQSRPGLIAHITNGDGPINGVFGAQAVFGGDMFSISGDAAYRVNTAVGTVPGTGKASWAAIEGQVIAARGLGLYRSTGAAFAQVAMPDNFNVASVAYLGGLFFAVKKGTQFFYFSSAFDSSAWDALDFAQAESGPDNLLDCVTVGSELWLIGEETCEPWQLSGELDAPVVPATGRVYLKGAKAFGCAVEADGALFFVSNDNLVCRGGDQPIPISEHWLSERLEGAAIVSLETLIWNGHTLLKLRVDAESFVYCIASGEWCSYTSWDRANFRGNVAATVGGVSYFGDDETGTVWRLGGYEDGSDQIVREFYIAANIKAGALPLDNVNLTMNTGFAPTLEGEGSEAFVELAMSRNMGRAFGNPRMTSAGRQGQYRERVQFRALGSFDAPGVVGRVRFSESAPFSVTDVTANLPYGSRGR